MRNRCIGRFATTITTRRIPLTATSVRSVVLPGPGARKPTNTVTTSVELLTVGGDHVVGAVRVADEPGSTVRSLRGLDEAFPTVRVLGVRHGDAFFGSPPTDLDLHGGDEIVVYGTRDALESLGDTDSSR